MIEPFDRRSLLESVIALTGNLEVALAALRTSGPAGTGSAVQVDWVCVRRAIEAFRMGELSADQLERWAEAVHGADDVLLDPSDEEFLSAALFELSTPQLFGSMEQIVAGLRERDQGPGDG